MEDGRSKSLEDIVVGEKVAVLDITRHQVHYEPILLFAHADPSQVTQFVRIVTEHGNAVTLTPQHYIYIGEGVESARLVEAGAVRVGDHVVIAETSGGSVTSDVVSDVTVMTSRGVYSPVVGAGNILVDGGVYASVYAADTPPLTPGIMHLLAWPLRVSPGHMLHVGGSHPQHGLPNWLHVLNLGRDWLYSRISPTPTAATSS